MTIEQATGALTLIVTLIVSGVIVVLKSWGDSKFPLWARIVSLVITFSTLAGIAIWFSRTMDDTQTFNPETTLASIPTTTTSTIAPKSKEYSAAIVNADNLSTRSGPSTEYREAGIYKAKGEYVQLISLAYDVNDVCWVQCEVTYGNKLRRVYTGLERFDIITFDFGSVPEETPLDYQAKVIFTSKAMYGPGDHYGAYDRLTVDKGHTVTIIAIENDYAQVDWKTSKQSYRAWVPIRTLEY